MLHRALLLALAGCATNASQMSDAALPAPPDSATPRVFELVESRPIVLTSPSTMSIDAAPDVEVDASDSADTPDAAIADALPRSDVRVDAFRPLPGPPAGPCDIWAADEDQLYRWHCVLARPFEVGIAHFPDGSPVGEPILELAVASDAIGYIVTRRTLLRVDLATAEVRAVGSFGSEIGWRGLTLYRGRLIGWTGSGDIYELDRASAALTFLVALPEPWVTAGDLVAVAEPSVTTLYGIVREHGIGSPRLATIDPFVGYVSPLSVESVDVSVQPASGLAFAAEQFWGVYPRGYLRIDRGLGIPTGYWIGAYPEWTSAGSPETPSGWE